MGPDIGAAFRISRGYFVGSVALLVPSFRRHVSRSLETSRPCSGLPACAGRSRSSRTTASQILRLDFGQIFSELDKVTAAIAVRLMVREFAPTVKRLA